MIMSRERRKYRKPPITEAVIDIRVRGDQAIPVTSLEQIGHLEKERYPTRLEGVQIVQEFEFEPSKEARKTSRTPIGFIFKSPDEKQVFQAQVHGFVFSRLRPYDTWETFSREARRLWDEYRDIAKPTAVERLAVRYINRFDFPLPVKSLADYLTVTPEVPPLISRPGNFLLRLVVPTPSLNATLIVHTVQVPALNENVGIVLDLDLYQEATMPLDDETIWQRLAELHEHVEDVFEACITDPTRHLIE